MRYLKIAVAGTLFVLALVANAAEPRILENAGWGYGFTGPTCDWPGLDAVSRGQLCVPEKDYACDWDWTPTTRHLSDKTFDYYESHFCDAAVCGGAGGSNACPGNATFPSFASAMAWIGEHPEGGRRKILVYAGTREVRIGRAAP